MKVISIFNNKGGVGKTTLTYHLAHILSEMGKRVLIIDLDSQCNLSLYGMNEEALEKIWEHEDEIIDNGFDSVDQKTEDFKTLFTTTRSSHFILKSVEEGISDFDDLPPPLKITDNLDLIPCRLTLFMYENKISERWSGMFLGEPLSIRTVTKIRKVAEQYNRQNHYDFVIIDTSPNLGALNKVVISTVDGFIIPCQPDMFSLYGIKNIGQALEQWKREFETCYQIISPEKRKEFPRRFVRFLGYTLYNAKKRSDQPEKLNLALAHYNYAKEIPKAIESHIQASIRGPLSNNLAQKPLGGEAIMHTHNTLPNMAQKYNQPMWKLPDEYYSNLEPEDKNTIRGNGEAYRNTRDNYKIFANDLLERVAILDQDE